MTSGNKLEAGNDIDSRCLKCKDVTNHTIIAMAEAKVAKVQCNVCGSRHNYRPVKPLKKVAAGKKRSPAKKATPRATKEAKAAALFEGMIEGRDQNEAHSYSMTATFNKDDLLDHPQFGLGLVVETIKPNKIEVLFKEGTKMLICALPTP